MKEKKYRDREGKFLVEGLLLCEELVASATYRKLIESLVFSPTEASSERARKLIADWTARGLTVKEIDPVGLKRLSDTVSPQGLIAVVRKAAVDFGDLLAAAPHCLLILDGVSDPGNLGTILRTANWFGADAVLLSANSVEWTNPKVVRSSMGAVFHIPVVSGLPLAETLSELANRGYSLFAAEAGGDTPFMAATFGKKNALIFGGETSGISQEVSPFVTTKLRIPGQGKCDSLNVAVAAGIILSEVFRRKSTS